MAEAESYRSLIEQEWADIHHSRVQEWTALGIIVGAHLGLIQLTKIFIDLKVSLSISSIGISASIIGAILSILGALMTCRHRHLMRVKLTWIYDAEFQLGLIKSDKNPNGVIPENALMLAPIEWRGLSLPRLLSTSGLIFSFYLVFFIIDLIVIAWI